MKPVILLLQNRRLLLHIAFMLVYLIVFLTMNWGADKMSATRFFTLMLLTGVGIGIAYQTRFAIVLAVRLQRFRSALLLFFGVMFVVGVVGYILFHGISNPMAEEIVTKPAEHPWKEYTFFYMRWYFNYAKYGLIFHMIEKALFLKWDILFARWTGIPMPEITVALAAVSGMTVTEEPLSGLSTKITRLSDQLNILLGLWVPGYKPEDPVPEITSFEPPSTPISEPLSTPLSEPTEAEPEHVTVSWILDFLNVARSTFYRSIRNQILFEVCKIGNRPYYLKKEVTDLMIRHEKGCWTFSKYLKERKEKQ